MNRQMMGALLVLNLVVGCATPKLTPVPRGEPLSIVFIKSPKAGGVMDIRNDDIAGDATAGAGTGAASGAVVGTLIATSCGPLFLVCAPITAAAGAVIGTATGAGVGAGVSVAGELSATRAAQLRERVGHVQQSHSLESELKNNVNDRARKYWKLDSDHSAAVVTVEVQDLMLSSMRDEQINCAIRVLVSVQRGVAKDSKTTEQKTYQYAAPTTSLSVWLDESNDFVDTVLTSASQQIATQIVSDLAFRDAADRKIPASESVESKMALPAPMPPGAWAGKWNVQGAPVATGVWVLKQEGEKVKSTGESYYHITGNASADRLDGDVLRITAGGDLKFNLVLSEDAKRFGGKLSGRSGVWQITGVRVD